MANSIDFRADQIQTSKIIVTGSTPQKTLLVYGIAADGSPANQGNIAPAVFDTSVVGSDVFLFVSGGIGARGGSDPWISAFGGDLHISGNLTVNGTFEVNGGITGSISGTVAGNPFIVAGSNVTANYNSLGQWEITGSGGVNFWTELDSTNIYTTSSVRVAGLSASLGAEITGSVTQGAAGNVASGTNSHAEGNSTTASGQYSHAEGSNTVALGNASHTAGIRTIASGSGQMAIGQYNTRNNNTSLFIVGNGTDDDDIFRSDIFRVNNTTVEVTGSLIAPSITGSIRYVEQTNTTPFLVAGSSINLNYNTLGQWEISSSIQKINVAGYNRTNLTSPTVIGLAYFNPTEYPNYSNLAFTAVGMNMAGVSGGLDLYDQNTSTLVAQLTWDGTSTLTTGSFQTTTLSFPASAKSYELHFSQSGGANGGTDYSTVGFVNFVLS